MTSMPTMPMQQIGGAPPQGLTALPGDAIPSGDFAQLLQNLQGQTELPAGLIPDATDPLWQALLAGQLPLSALLQENPAQLSIPAAEASSQGSLQPTLDPALLSETTESRANPMALLTETMSAAKALETGVNPISGLTTTSTEGVAKPPVTADLIAGLSQVAPPDTTTQPQGGIPEQLFAGVLPQVKIQKQPQQIPADPKVSTAEISTTEAAIVTGRPGTTEPQSPMLSADQRSGLLQTGIDHPTRTDKPTTELPDLPGQPITQQVGTASPTTIDEPGPEAIVAQIKHPADDPLQQNWHSARAETTNPVTGSKTTATEAVLQLPSGTELPEQQLLDQVIGKLRVHPQGDGGQAVLKLYPKELGEIRLDLKLSSDRLQAHLQVQSSQVQEVLERHLPRLRDSLEQQGLKIDLLQVGIENGRSQNDSWQSFDQQSGWTRENQPFSSRDYPADDLSDTTTIETDRTGHHRSSQTGVSIRI